MEGFSRENLANHEKVCEEEGNSWDSENTHQMRHMDKAAHVQTRVALRLRALIVRLCVTSLTRIRVCHRTDRSAFQARRSVIAGVSQQGS